MNTNTSKHTPGDWQVHSGYLIRSCVGDFCHPVAELRTPYRHGMGIIKGERENWANAHLIAAAPALLEALKELERVYERGDFHTEFSPALNKARAAIAKAKGKP